MTAKSIVCVGECMLELTGSLGTLSALSFGGDTFNTAAYLARFGLRPSYLTALGEDPYSDELLAAWSTQGIGTELVVRCPGKLPGLYGIRTDAEGERCFYYWRSESAARSLFSCPGIDAALGKTRGADLLYLSGITLSLYPQEGRKRLLELAREVRGHGGEVAFDPNFRPACWRSAQHARIAVEELAPLVSIALPTLQDEAALWGDASAEIAAARWRGWGAREVVVKLGAQGAWLSCDAREEHIAALPGIRVLDTTGAGDAFNAGYLASRVRGASPSEGVRLSHRLAAVVIQHRGAIVPSEATSGVCQVA